MQIYKQYQISFIVVLLVLSGLLLGCAPNSVASAAADYTDARTITVIGRGQAVGIPDQAQAQVGVEVFADTVQQAVNENETTIQAIMKALTAQGIDPKDIQTSNYNLWVEQRYNESGPQGIAGYRIANQVTITIRDLGKMGDVLAAAIEAGANNISSQSLSIADPAALEAEAREQAMANAYDRAAELASLAQVSVGDVVTINEANNQPFWPAFSYGRGGAAEAADVLSPSISPGQMTFEVQVQVTFSIK